MSPLAEGSPAAAVVTGVALGTWVVGGAIYRFSRRRAPGEAATTAVGDPGWRPALMRMGPPRSPGSADPLTAMRIIFLAFLLTWLAWSFVVSLMVPWSGEDPGPALGLVVGVGVLSLVGIGWVRSRRLTPISESSLQGQMRTVMFLGLAIAEVPGLIGIVAAIARESLWLYLVGAAFSIVDMALIAPGRREIARRQRRLAEDRAPFDLTQALMLPAMPSPPA
jgi:F0F1-type ATP synthase membrane subunit c/vacuolar-type H+-ATPase subunit K